MNHEKLLSAINSASAATYSSDDTGNLSDIRARSIDDYLGQPYGDEVEGQSQVVSRDVYDTVEWIKPALLRIFAGGDQVCAFNPIGPEDEKQAEQESDYVNHIVMDKNDWFSICLEWFTDCLLTKNAYAMAYWDDSVEIEKDDYEGLTDNQLTALVQDGWEIKKHTAKPDEAGMQMYQQQAQQMAMQAQASGMPFEPPPPPMLHDVEVTREQPKGKCCIKVLPPERCKVGQDTPSFTLRDCSYFEYWDDKTISELRAMGLEVDDDEGSEGGADTEEDAARDEYGEEENRSASTDPSMRKLRTRMIWIRCDANEDGIAELVYCIRVNDKIKYAKEVSRIAVASISAVPMPHRHVSLSIRDAVTDIQRIKTVIWRQVLNNLYLANNGRYGISDKVNLDDMLVSRAGGVVRVKGSPAAEIMPFNHPFIGPQALGVMEYADQLKDSRTGVNKVSAGLDPKAIDANVGTVSQLTSAASQRLELIARIIAEGVKDLFSIVHELLLKHDHKVNVVKIKGNWVEVDPRQWKKRQDLRITVGVGTGNKEVMMQHLMMIAQYQEKALPLGIATPQNIYNTAVELTKVAGFANSDQFWTQPQPQPPAPDPNAGLIMVEKYKADTKAKTDIETAQMDNFTKLKIEEMKLTGVAADHRHDKEMAAISHGAKLMENGAVEEKREEPKEPDQIAVALSQVASALQSLSAPKRRVPVRDKSGRISHLDEVSLA